MRALDRARGCLEPKSLGDETSVYPVTHRDTRMPEGPAPSTRWNVEIHLSPGGIVWERTWAVDWRAAIEAALARSRIVAEQVNGIVAYPAASHAA